MAPAVTSDTAPCTRAPRLCAASLPTSPLNGDSADVCGTVATMNSNPPAAGVKPSDGQVFHPFACMPASLVAGRADASSESARLDPLLLHPPTADNGSTTVSDIVNGFESRLSQPNVQLSLVNLINSQRTLNFVIKNNGTCSSSVLGNNTAGSVGSRLSPATDNNCNGSHVIPGSVAPILPPVSQLLLNSVAVKNTSACAVSSALCNLQSTPPVCGDSTTTLTAVPDRDICQVTENGCKPEMAESNLVKAKPAEADCGIAASGSAIPCGLPKSNQLSVKSVSTRQQDLIARAELTLRRLRRLQTRQANSSVRQQIAGLVSAIRRPKTEPSACNGLEQANPTPTDLKSMSTSELVGLVRRMQTTADAGRLHGFVHPEGDQLDLSVCSRFEETAGKLSSNLRHLETAIDSDATESSSGGESDEELDTDLPDASQYVVISELTDPVKAKLSWASERAMIASRWTWLQAQVSDLEYRIRQQSDIYRQLRSIKGAVSFRDLSPVPGDTTTTDHSATPSSTACQKSDSCCDDAAPVENQVMPATDSTLRAARCRPVKMGRRRRLVRLQGNIHLSLQRRSAFVPLVRCAGCHPPATPCTLCAGRVTNSCGVTASPHIPMLEKVALLDPAFHPVLSFLPDIQLTARLADCVRQMPVAANLAPISELATPASNRGLTIKISKAHLKSSLSVVPMRNFVSQGNRVCEANAMRRPCIGPDGDRVGPGVTSSNSHVSVLKTFSNHMTARRAVADAVRYRNRYANKRLGRSGTGSGLKPGRPPGRLSQSASSASLKDGMRRPCASTSSMFDINNVVIPYCAAVTRVETLEYKEIQTPKWREAPKVEPLNNRRRSTLGAPPFKRLKRDSTGRVRSQSTTEDGIQSAVTAAEVPCPVANEPTKTASETSVAAAETDSDREIEDLSDEAFVSRHLRYEIYEKKQCMPLTGKRRRSRSNRSESDHSLTLTANPRSPDASMSSETFDALTAGGSHFSFHPFIEPARPTEPVTFHLPEQVSPFADGVPRRSGSTSSFSRASSFVFDARTCTLEPPSEVSTPRPSWPQRTFPLTDTDYEQLVAEERSSVMHRRTSHHAATPLPSVPVVPLHVSTMSTIKPSSSETSLSTVTDIGESDDPEFSVPLVTHQTTTTENETAPGFCLKTAKL